MDYIIRPCAEKDVAELVKLCANHAAFEHADYDPKGKASLLGDALFAANPKLFCAVIQCENTLQGYFSYTFDFSTWDAQLFLYLDCLYLEPGIRGQGIGQVVFEKLKEIAKQHKCVTIQWQTPSFNERAIQFYHRIGATGKNKMRFFIDPQKNA